jgi:hypothetical protein
MCSFGVWFKTSCDAASMMGSADEGLVRPELVAAVLHTWRGGRWTWTCAGCGEDLPLRCSLAFGLWWIGYPHIPT